MYKYEFEGKTFIQKKLVWGQVRQLVSVLRGMEFNPGVESTAFLEMLGDKLPLALAVVLTEEGQSPKDKDLTALASFFEFAIPIDIALEVIDDFFACNPTALLVEKVTKLVGEANKAVDKHMMSSSSTLDSFSVAETSPKEMQ